MNNFHVDLKNLTIKASNSKFVVSDTVTQNKQVGGLPGLDETEITQVTQGQPVEAARF